MRNVCAMAKIINLKTIRKQKARDASRKTGDENAARSGISKVEKTKVDAENRAQITHLDGHKRDK